MSAATGRLSGMDDPTNISEYLGGRIRELREAEGVTQDELARAARRVSLTWRRSTVAAIEGGSRSLALEEFLLLPTVLSMALGEEFGIRDLFGNQRRVHLTPDVEAEVDWLLEMLGGVTETLGHMRGSSLKRDQSALTLSGLMIRRDEWMAHVDEVRASVPRGTSIRVMQDGQREGEQKAGRRLGVSGFVIAEAAHRLWDHGLTDERERRLREAAPEGGERQVRAVRGHITRRLMEELAPVVEVVSEEWDEREEGTG